MSKLLKLSEMHYIVVDNSEIKQNDIVCEKLLTGGYELFTIQTLNDIDTNNQFKVTHSNLPLDCNCAVNNRKLNLNCAERNHCFNKIQQLSLSEVEEVVNGFNVENIVKEYVQELIDCKSVKDSERTWISAICHQMFLKAQQELAKDKFILTKDQLFKIIAMSKLAKTYDGLIDMDSWISNGYEGATPAYTEEEIIQSLLPKTEWGVEFDTQGKLKLK